MVASNYSPGWRWVRAMMAAVGWKGITLHCDHQLPTSPPSWGLNHSDWEDNNLGRLGTWVHSIVQAKPSSQKHRAALTNILVAGIRLLSLRDLQSPSYPVPVSCAALISALQTGLSSCVASLQGCLPNKSIDIQQGAEQRSPPKWFSFKRGSGGFA